MFHYHISIFVGQQNVPMPPRPSSGQSDGGSVPGPPTARISHSPNQGILKLILI